jgi:hypothetical protein
MKKGEPLEDKLTHISQPHKVKLQPLRLSGIFRTQEPCRFGGRCRMLKIESPKAGLVFSNDC